MQQNPNFIPKFLSLILVFSTFFVLIWTYIQLKHDLYFNELVLSIILTLINCIFYFYFKAKNTRYQEGKSSKN